MTSRCVACGAAGRLHRHHPTGRDRDRRYLHSEFTLALCEDCHRLAHVALRAAGVERRGCVPAEVLDPVSLALRRLAVLFSWLSVQGRSVTLPAEALEGVAAVLDQTASRQTCGERSR